MGHDGRVEFNLTVVVAHVEDDRPHPPLEQVHQEHATTLKCPYMPSAGGNYFFKTLRESLAAFYDELT